jgi:L-asparaginase II
MKQGDILLEVVRNEMVESIHSGHLLMMDGSGKTVLQLGDLDQLIYPRSAVKSLQASAMVRHGLKLNGEQLAVVCASHAGSQRHLDVITSILRRANLDESALKNTPDKPLGNSERAAWADRPISSLAANCSGKHAGMLATCAINQWDLETYKDPAHPLQLAIKREFESLSGTAITKIGVDGCGAPLFALSLRNLATAIRNLTLSADPVHREVISACRDNPYFVSGTGRLPTMLMEKVPGLFVKDGAEGVMVMSLPDGTTVVWKMSDGSQRGAGALAIAALARCGVRIELESEKVLGDGRIVGEIRASRIIHHG